LRAAVLKVSAGPVLAGGGGARAMYCLSSATKGEQPSL